MIAGLLLLTESVMGSKNSREPTAKKKQVRRGQDNKDEASDDEGRVSSEESTVAGSPLAVSPTFSCSTPSIDQDELSDVESVEHEQPFQSLSLKAPSDVDESNIDGFCLVGRRIAGIFAALDEASLEEGSDDLPESEDGSDDEKIDIVQWHGVGKRLASLAWLDMENSDLDD